MTQAKALPVEMPEDAEQTVLDYLARTPDFFERHAEWLAEQAIRHDSGGAVSLIERQVRVLRERNEKLHQRLDGLLQTARENEHRVNGLNRLAENLIRADSLTSVVAGLSESLHAEFNVEAVRLCLFETGPELDQAGCLSLSRDEPPADLSDFFRQLRIICGPMQPQWRELLFAEHAELKSVALVPLGRQDCLGLLALGSTDALRFTPQMGNLFLDMTAKLCTAALRFHGAGQD